MVAALLVVLTLFVACEQNSTAPLARSLTVMVNDLSDAKTISPSGNVNISHYVITVSNQDTGDSVSSGYLEKGQAFSVMNIAAGTWTAKVDAYVQNEYASGGYVHVATATSDPVRVSVDSEAKITVTLDEILVEQSDDVSITLMLPSDFASGENVYVTWALDGDSSDYSIAWDKALELHVSESGTVSFTLDADNLLGNSEQLMQGVYTISVEVADSKETASQSVVKKGVEVLRLLAGLPASGVINLSAETIVPDGADITIVDQIGDQLLLGATDISTDGSILTVNLGYNGIALNAQVKVFVDGAEISMTGTPSYNVEDLSGGKQFVISAVPEGEHLITFVVDTEKPIDIGSLTIKVIVPEFSNIVGVAWNYGDDSSPQLFRLYTSQEVAESVAVTNENMKTKDDPYDLVTRDILSEPISSHDGIPGSSPFDEFGPWQDMKLVAMADGGEILDTIEPGETIREFIDEHDANNMDFMVYLPDVYVRVIDDPYIQVRYYYVSDEIFNGAELHPASGHYIGRYDAMDPDISGSQSDSNKADEVYSRPSYKATGVQQVARYLTHQDAYDVTRKRNEGIIPVDGKMYRGLIWQELSYVQLLYLIEYANLDSQSTLGVGDNTYTSGDSDDMPYHTGVIGSKNSYGSDIQYRYVEGLFGRDATGEIIENLLAYANVVYMAPDEDSLTAAGDDDAFTKKIYSPKVPSDWIEIGTLPKSGYIKTFHYDEEKMWSIGLPKTTGGSGSTYSCDYLFGDSNERMDSIILHYRNASYNHSGAWFMQLSYTVNSSYTSDVSARLSFR